MSTRAGAVLRHVSPLNPEPPGATDDVAAVLFGGAKYLAAQRLSRQFLSTWLEISQSECPVPLVQGLLAGSHRAEEVHARLGQEFRDALAGEERSLSQARLSEKVVSRELRKEVAYRVFTNTDHAISTVDLVQFFVGGENLVPGSDLHEGAGSWARAWCFHRKAIESVQRKDFSASDHTRLCAELLGLHWALVSLQIRFGGDGQHRGLAALAKEDPKEVGHVLPEQLFCSSASSVCEYVESLYRCVQRTRPLEEVIRNAPLGLRAEIVDTWETRLRSLHAQNEHTTTREALQRLLRVFELAAGKSLDFDRQTVEDARRVLRALQV